MLCNDLLQQKQLMIHGFERFALGREHPPWPMEVFIETSNLCDLKCAMCPTFSDINPYRFFALKETRRAFFDESLQPQLESVLRRALSVHCFGYGEPTINPSFFAFVDGLYDFRVMVDFFTNGMHLTEEFNRKLVEQNVYRVTISFSGANREDYENIYLGGDFHRVLRGIENLASHKQNAGKQYPIIEINSIAFEHHVQNLEPFIDLMADRGVNVIHLKSLQNTDNIPQLAAHRAVLRPWVEGEILQRANEKAKARGVWLSADQFELTKVTSNAEWNKQKGVGSTQSAATVPISQIQSLAKKIHAILPQQSTKATPTPEICPTTRKQLEEALGIEARGEQPPFYCMEPFKTLYFTQSGKVKPCCFAANSDALLGSLTQSDAAEIWQALPLQLLRQGITQHAYAATICGPCLDHLWGPRNNDIARKVQEYSQWYQSAFGEESGLEFEFGSWLFDDHEWIMSNQRNAVEMLDSWKQACCVEAEDPDLKTLLEGNLDGIEGKSVFGWVWSPRFPGLRLELTLLINGAEIKDTFACQHRVDLEQANKGDGYHGFTFSIPDVLSGTGPWAVSIQVKDTNFKLGPINYSQSQQEHQFRQHVTTTVESTLESPNEQDQKSFVYNWFFPLTYDPGIHELRICKFFCAFNNEPDCYYADIQANRVQTGVFLCFSNRSGSNFLAQCLSATGYFQLGSESLNHEQVVKVSRKLDIRHFSNYLEHLIDIPEKEHKIPVMKASWDQLYFLFRIGAVHRCFPRWRFLYILREDMLAQSLSLAIARRTNIWQGPSEQELGEDFYRSITVEELTGSLEYLSQSHAQFLKLFSVLDIQPLVISYEDLLENPQAATENMMMELGLTDQCKVFDESAILSPIQRNLASARLLRSFRRRFSLSQFE